MRILHTSDWHLGRNLEGRSRLPEQEEFLDELCRIADEEKVDLVLVAGDVFDSFTPQAAAEELYYNALERLSADAKRAVVVIAGNHDSPDRIRAANPLAAKHGISLVGYPGEDLGTGGPPDGARRVRSGPGWFEVLCPSCDETAFVVTLAYPSESRLNECLGDSLDEHDRQAAYSDRVSLLLQSCLSQVSRDAVRLVVGHLYVSGGWECDSERQIQLGGAFAVRPDVLTGASYVALGHLHRPQPVHGSRVPCRYSGSPLAYSFSESDQQKEVVIVEVKGSDAVVRPVKLACGKPLKKWVATDFAEALAWCRDERNHNAWVDLEIQMERPLFDAERDLLRKSHPGLVNIRCSGLPEGPSAEEVRIGELPIAERFKLFCQRNGVSPDEELVELFLELLHEAEEEGSSGETAQA